MAYDMNQQIQERMDTYRGREPALAQRYQMKQELVDLLALQKLKSQKDQAAQQVQLSMQTNPQTIMQQREAELLGAAKQDVAKGVAGALAQKQRQQQANLQKIAQSGVAGQAPTMRMAEGGIVGFAAGGETKAERIKAIQEDDSLSVAEKKEQIQEIIESGAQLPTGTISSATSPDDRGSIPQGMETNALDQLGDAVTGRDDEDSGPTKIDTSANIGIGASLGNMQGPPQATQTIKAEPAQQNLPMQPPPEAPKAPGIAAVLNPDMSGVRAAPAGLNSSKYAIDYNTPERALANSGIKTLMERDADQEYRDATARYQETAGMTDAEKQEIKDRRTARTDLTSRMLDPERKRQDLIDAYLMGTSGRGSLAAMSNVRRGYDLAESKRQAEDDAAFNKELERSLGIRKSSAQAGATAFESARGDQRTGTTAATSAANQKDTNLNKEADRLLKIDTSNLSQQEARRAEELKAVYFAAEQGNKVAVANATNALQAEANDIKREANKIASADRRFGYLQRSISVLTSSLSDYAQRITSDYAKQIDAVRNGALNSAMNEAQKNAKIALLEKERDEIIAKGQTYTKGVLADLQSELNALSGGQGGGSINLSASQQNLVNQYAAPKP